MLIFNSELPKIVLSTSQLTFQQVQELAILTPMVWQTPVQALTPQDTMLLSIITEHIFSSIPEKFHLPLSPETYYRPSPKRWADRDDEDDLLPEFPASWKC